MTKKIILDVLKKSKWSMLMSIIILVYLYREVSTPVFIYFVFLQIWFIHMNITNKLQKMLNAVSEEWIVVASDKIKEIVENLSEFRKIYDDLIAYIKDDKDIH
jgi:hypothetical protein